MDQSLHIEIIPLLTDNYAYLLQDAATGTTAIVDPSEAQPVIKAPEARRLKLDLIINTHHHWDHVGGNPGLKAKFECRVAGPSYDRERLIGLTEFLADGDTLKFGDATAKVMHIPGHTTGHIALWFEENN